MQCPETNFESKLLRIIWILVVGWTLPVMGQQLTMSALPTGRNGQSNYRVVGENAGGVYLMNYRDADMRRNFTLLKVNHQLQYLQEKPIELGKKSRLIKIFTHDSGVCLIYTEKIKQELWIRYRNIDLDMESEYTGNLGLINNSESSQWVTAEYSNNREWCGIWSEEQSEEGLQRIGVMQFHLPTRRINRHTHYIPFTAKSVSIDETSMANNGAFACAILFEDDNQRSSKPASRQYFIAHGDSAGTKPLLPVNAGAFFVGGSELVRDEFRQRFLFSGFYDLERDAQVTGYFTLPVYDSASSYQSGASLLKEPLPPALVVELIGAGLQEKGRLPDNLFIRKIVPRDDGGQLLVAEEFYVTQQLETFYINGVPQTSSKNVYHYDDAVLIAVSPQGAPEWFKVVRKRQSGYSGTSYYNGIATYVCDSTVQLMYNDNATQNNRVTHLQIDRKGAILQHVLFNSDEVYTGFIPQEGKQTGYNRFIVPLIMEKQTMLLKVTKKE